MTDSLNITVGVDTEDAARVAVDWTISLSRRRPTHLTLLSAFDMLMVAPVDEEERVRAEAARVADAVPGTPVEPIVVEGSIHETLRAYSARSDLLVIGSHHSRRWRSLLSGNLPARMAGITACPIVIVPDDWTPHEGRIVVGLADDDSSDSALEWAAGYATSLGLELDVVHAWLRPDPPSDPVSLYLGAPRPLQDEHREHLAEAVAGLRRRHPGLTITETLFEGASANGLNDLRRTAELLVVGSHRYGPIAGLFFGSVAQDLIRHSDAAICVVPNAPADSVPERVPVTSAEQS